MSSALQAEQRKASAARLRRLCAHVRDGPSSASLIASGAAAADSFAEGDAPRRFLPPARDVGGMPGAYPEEGEGEYEDEDEGPTLAEENAARGRNDVYNRKWDGWGYEDTEFFISDDNEVCLAGERYGQNFEAERVLPEFRAWVEAKVDGFTTDETSFPVGVMPDLDPSVMNDAFLAAIEGAYVELCFDDEERLFHAHGHTTRELYDLRTGKGFPRTPDAVVYPSSHENVETIMAAAVLHDACIIPFGGGTSVTGALLCPDTEKRMIISVDMRRMNRIKWVDRESMLCCIEAGAAGQELDKALAARGLRLGHEPDSGEFSTVGGWVATRASGMKKSVYGNIEDMLINVKVVTPIGVLDRPGNAPRQVRSEEKREREREKRHTRESVVWSYDDVGVASACPLCAHPYPLLPPPPSTHAVDWPRRDTDGARLRGYAWYRYGSSISRPHAPRGAGVWLDCLSHF